jgi:hypothetical protein
VARHYALSDLKRAERDIPLAAALAGSKWLDLWARGSLWPAVRTNKVDG